MTRRYNRLLCSIAVIVCMLITNLDGRVRTIQSQHEFDQQAKKSHIMIVMFYNKKQGDRKDVDQLLRIYEKISAKKLYDDADITFVKMNGNKSDSYTIAQRYNVAQFPTIIMFNNSKPIVDQNGKIVSLINNISENQVYAMIDRFCSEDIRIAVESKKQRADARMKDARDPSNPYFYPSVEYTPSGDISSWAKPSK